MSRGIANDNNPCTTWFWRDWQRDTAKLTKAEKGMWIDLIGECAESPTLGDWTGPIATLISYGETLENCWQMLQGLGAKKVADVEVMIGGKMEAVTAENYPAWGAFKPLEMTPIRVVCRRLVRQRERNEKEANRKRLSRGEQDTERTECGQNADTERTESGLDADRMRTGCKPQTVTTRARTSPISSTIVEDYMPSSEGEKKKTTPLVDADFITEMEAAYLPLGVDVRTEAVLAEKWVTNRKRKFTRRFFQDTWLNNEARVAAARRKTPRGAMQAARDAGEFTGERLCPDYDGKID